jgi:hypothetical protein
LVHKNDGLYDTSNWIIDQSSFVVDTDNAKKRPLKKKSIVVSSNSGNTSDTSPPQSKSASVPNTESMEDKKYTVDSRTNSFLGKKKDAPSFEGVNPMKAPKVVKTEKQSESEVSIRALQ